MTIIQIIALIAQLSGAAKDIADIVNELRSTGHPDNEMIPEEHANKIQAILASVDTSEWDIDHENTGG